MILLHNVVEIFDFTDGDSRAVLRIIALDGRFIGRTPVNGDLRRHAVAADGLGQEPLGGLLVTFLGEEKVDRLARFINGAIEIAPPTDPHRALTPVKRLFQQQALLDGPPVDGGVIDVHPRSSMSSSTWRVLSGYATYQRTPRRMTSLGKWAPLKLTAIVTLSHDGPLLTGKDHTSNRLK
jgi:hypothetical protein